MSGMKKMIALACALVMVSCSQPPLVNMVDSMFSQDRQLPRLVSMRTLDMSSVLLSFSKEVTLQEARIDGMKAVWRMDGPSSIVVTSPSGLDISTPSDLFIRVADSSHNSSAFHIPLYGLNDRIPPLVINELSSKGTPTQPDRIELEIRGDGNLEGICVMDGTKGNEKHSFILPDIDVERGDYVVIWWDSVPDEEVQENDDGSTVFNLAASSKEGLATNNGVFVVYRTPSGDDDVIDALVYTNGESTSYSGFGSARVEASYNGLTASFDWMGPAFNSRHSTSTRTVSRRNNRMDTDSASDFYITVTRGQTFGRMNSSAEYVPEEKTASGPGDVL